jgi:hypothetical protein
MRHPNSLGCVHVWKYGVVLFAKAIAGLPIATQANGATCAGIDGR